MKKLLNSKAKTKFIKKLKIITFIFLIFNFFIFTVPIIQHSIGRPYATAKAFCTTAATINIVYIYPLSKLFGYKNPLTIFFYVIRDGLYNTGISLYPKEEGEREVQWFLVRYWEYDNLAIDLLKKYTTGDGYQTEDNIKILQQWLDELYSHLKPFSSSKINDSHLRKLRFNQFMNYALATYYFKSSFRERVLFTDPKNIYKIPILRNNKELKEIEQILFAYQNLKKYAVSYEKDGLDYYYNHTTNADIEYLLQIIIADDMIDSKIIRKKLVCSDPYVKLRGKSFENLYNLKNKSKDLINHLKFQRSFALDLLKTCPNVPELQTYKKHIESFHNFEQYCPEKTRCKTIEDIKLPDISKEEYKLDGNVYKY